METDVCGFNNHKLEDHLKILCYSRAWYLGFRSSVHVHKDCNLSDINNLNFYGHCYVCFLICALDRVHDREIDFMCEGFSESAKLVSKAVSVLRLGS